VMVNTEAARWAELISAAAEFQRMVNEKLGEA
jgi:hypothetical protein